MSLFLQSPLSTGVLAAFCSGRHVDTGSVKFFGLLPGVARRQPTFFASPKKVGKERRPEVRRPGKSAGVPFGKPCMAFRFRRHVPWDAKPLPTSKRRAAAELGLEQLPRNRLRLCSPSNSPRGLPPRLLCCSATLMGPSPFATVPAYSLSSRRKPGPNLT